MEAVEALMLLFDRPLVLPALPALPVQPVLGVEFPALVVPVREILDAADESKKLGNDNALNRLEDYVELFSTSCPVRKGRSSQVRGREEKRIEREGGMHVCARVFVRMRATCTMYFLSLPTVASTRAAATGLLLLLPSHFKPFRSPA
ncbi:unnamed protein product [Ectocarpus sp. 4 AP-2014]